MNSAPLRNLSAMEYPGRLIIIGAEPKAGKPVVVYAVTGRSPSSQARKLEWTEEGVWVRPTDEEVLKKGNVDLLVYPAILYGPGGVAVSNGKQTEDIRRTLSLAGGAVPTEILSGSLTAWSFEPDAPIFTPRISGCIVPGPKAGLSLIKRDADDSAIRRSHKVPLAPGKGKLISTYDGVNRDPLRSFAGDPLDVDIKAADPGTLAEAVYEALKPSDLDKDFRVAVACLFAMDMTTNEYEISIINRHERS